MPTDAPPAAAATPQRGPRVYVTRPEHEARRWVEQLVARGIDAHALPLIVIRPATETSTLASAWQCLASYRAAMFVSPAAVDYFFALRPPAAGHLPTALRWWAPGPGTARALRAVGVAATQIDTPAADAAQFDSEHLWQQAGPQVQAGDAVLVVRGSTAPSARSGSGPGSGNVPPTATGDGREWMAQRLADAGASVDYCVAYRREAPTWTPADTAALMSSMERGATLVFSSSEAVHHWSHLMPHATALPAGPVAVCTHPRIAEAARHAGFTRVVGTRPTVEAVAAVLDGLAREVP